MHMRAHRPHTHADARAHTHTHLYQINVLVSVCKVVPETVPMVCLLGGSRRALIRWPGHWSSHILALLGK